MACNSSTIAWKIPWMEEPGRLQSMGSWRVGHDWETCLSIFTFMHWRRKWQPTPVFLPDESQGRGSLGGCCLWGRKESDTIQVTEHSTSQREYCGICFWGSLSKPARNFTFTANLIIPALRVNMRLTPTSQKKNGCGYTVWEKSTFSLLRSPLRGIINCQALASTFFPQGQGHRTSWSRIKAQPIIRKVDRDFPGHPVIRMQCFHYLGPGFSP